MAEKKKGLIRGIGSFLGIEKFGQGIGQAAFQFTPEAKELERLTAEGKVSPEEFTQISTGGLRPREIVGSAAQTALNIGSLGGGKILGGGLRQASKQGAKLGAAFGGAEAVEEGTGLVPGALKGATLGALGGAVAQSLQRGIAGATKRLPERLNQSVLRQGIKDLQAEAAGKKPVLAQQMIQRRIKGSPTTIIEESSNQLSKLEKELVQTLERNKNTSISTVNLIRSLDNIVSRKRNVYGDKGVEVINNFKKVLKSKGDKLNVIKANQLKRDISIVTGKQYYQENE